MIEVYVSGANIAVGRQGENAARNIYFDLSDLINIYGEGTATLVHMRPSDQAPYVCETSVLGTFLVWTPSSTDTAFSGSGKCELRWVVGDTLAKSIIYTTNILPSITGAGEVPSAYQSWYDSIIAYIEANYAANGAPQEVREAIYTLLSKAAYTETGLADELAIVEEWTAETFSITNYLTYATNSNTATMASLNDSYTATISAVSGYVLNSVTVTMGGDDITATVYSSGTITIPAVTGDIVITATAVAAVSSLSAVYTQSGNVYDDFTLADLTDNLVVTATYSDSSTAVIASSSYTLSGTLEVGTTSTITVSYGGATATFNVVVSTPLYPLTVGTHTFTNPAGTIEVYNSNSARVICSTANNRDTHANLSTLSSNTAACNSTNNYVVSTPIFTIPAGSTVRAKLIVNSLTSVSTTTYGSSTLRKPNGTATAAALIFAETSALKAGIPDGTVFEVENTFDTATEISCLGVYFGNRGASTAASIDVSFIVYVDGVRYI